MIKKLLNIFNLKDKPLLGIDIATESIKVLELEFSNGKYTVDAYHSLPTDPSMMDEGKIVNIEGLGGIIGRTVTLAGAKSKLAAVGIPSSLAISSVLSFPDTLSTRDVESEIRHDAETLIPYPLEEVSFDFTKTGTSEGSNEFTLAATRNENIEERIDLLAASGLTPAIIDIESYAIQNSFSLISGSIEGHNENTVVALFDIGSSRTTLYILKGGRIIFTRDEAFGGVALTQSISQRYELSLIEAEKVKKMDKSEMPEDYEEEVLLPFMEGLSISVNRMINFFLSASNSVQHVEHVLLSGGCASIDGIDGHVEAKAGIETTVANPLENMIFSKRVSKERVMKVAPALMIACGLAMRSSSNDSA